MADDNSKIEDEYTLAKVIAEKGVLSIKEAVAVTLQLLKSVDNLHLEGKFHRQISANTVSLNESMSATLAQIETEVILGGIGVDLIPCPPQLHNIPPLALPAEIKSAQQVLTEAGILLDPRQIDFYQLGALLCFMVCGHSVSDYLRSCKAKAGVPKEIAPIIDRALGLNSKSRFSSSVAFAAALQAVVDGKPSAEERSSLPDSIFVEPSSKAETEVQLAFKKLGHYEIIERIGHGGMGDVYKGYEKALDRFVAIKVLPAALARQKEFVKRFHAEATAIAKIDHPNIVRIYYSGEDNGNHFFAMQYVEGESLADLLTRRNKLSATEAMPIIEQCLAGIGAAHKRGLIHRDIKPGNVLLDRHSRRALVTDFGVVKAVQTETQITVTGTIMGTADYISPEQARGLEVDCRTDLYAMGVLIYQMLSGKLPFDAKSATSMMFQHAYEPPPRLSEAAPEVPEQLATVVMKLIAKKPENRYQSADEVLCELHNISLRPEAATSSSQRNIIEAPIFYSTPELPHNLSELTGKNWFGRLRNRIADFFGTHAPQVIEYMQTTSQQVDGAVSEYQRQRDKLADLTKEAKANAAEFESQAKTSRRLAQAAGERAEGAKSTTAKQQALKEKQENEQTAAELSQLAAEQHQQAEEIDLKLAKLDAKLAQLRSQRDALNARMNGAKARLKSEQARPPKWRPSKRLLHIAIIIFLICTIGAFLYGFWLKLYQSQPEPYPAGPSRPELVTLLKDAQPGSLLAWGWTKEKRCNVPAGADYVSVSADRHSLGLKSNGTLTAFGCNCFGQCNVLAVNDFVAISAGFIHSLALRMDGSLVAWGRNNHGQCNAPKGYDFVAISAGSWHSVALKADGSLVGWGRNQEKYPVPKGKDFVAIAAGGHSLALRTDGSLVAWGRNEDGQCDVPDCKGFVAISVGEKHSLALKADGTLVAWGGNKHGQCNVPSGNDFVAISSGYHHNLALRANGTLVAWGLNQYGQCNVPTGKRFIAISAGRFHNLAIVTDKPKTGLIAHWKFDEGSGNKAYDSAGTNHGKIDGAIWTDGQIGKALNFDGNDDFVRIGSDVSIADMFDNFTISLWANPLTIHEIDSESATSWRGIGGQKYAIAPVHGDGMWEGGHAGAGISIGTNGISVYEHGDRHYYSPLVWKSAVSGFTHVTVVYENKHPHLYVNGVLKRTGLTSPRIVHALPGTIGGENHGYFKGKIDEVRIYNKALSAQEIQRLYAETASKYEKPKVSGWVDVLKLIDPKRDTRAGQWRFENGVLTGFAESTLETTYELPAEYDVLWEFESDSTAVDLLLASPIGKRFEWMMKGWSHKLCAIRDVDCKPANGNPTTTVYPMASGTRYVSEIRVRKDRFVALINGEEILNYKTDWSNIEICSRWDPSEVKPRTLGIWLNKYWTKTYQLKVKPHSEDHSAALNYTLSSDELLKKLAELEQKKREARERNDREAFKKARDECDQFLKEHPDLKTN